MPALTGNAMLRLLEPYSPGADATLIERLSLYLDLLLKWNERTNLTAIRRPEEIVRRHFGESLFVARHLPACATLLDFGSGAGFPGLPIQLVRTALQVTLAESQHKKAAFLQEAVRVLGLRTEVWPRRVEAMPTGRQFDVVTLRAVDDPHAAVVTAASRVRAGGWLAELTTGEGLALPGSQAGVLRLVQLGVPRGTEESA